MPTLSIPNKDISFVVQGPVQASDARKQIPGVTKRTLDSIRQYFPGSSIVLSTWKGQALEGLDFDKLIELDDPGQNSVFNNDIEQKLNNNRQLYSSHMGLTSVKTKYAVKMRSDNVLIGRGFVELFEKYHCLDRTDQDKLLKERVVTSSAFFISHHRGAPNYFCKSDLFDFGLTEDLLKIWSETLLGELRFYPAKGYKSRPPATEQFLCLKWISEIKGIELLINSRINDDAGLGPDFWDKCIAANLIVAKPEEIGLDTTERFYRRGNLLFEYDLADWKELAGIEKQPFNLKKAIRFIRNSVENTNRFFYKRLKG
ncbi:WavE lipopolysaccharide synthesis family protein [Enterovibrio norvegicus]|uniref:WavE lipopolysaccharide synthesis family protein n=3 Tax=Enterovibrio norvegicus TaxID=188144 RepID=UPI00352F515E